MIRSLNHLHYISSDQSHSMKASYINHLTKTFRFFLEFVRTVTLKLIYIRTCYDTYMHMCQAIFDSPIDRHNIINYINTLYCTKCLYSINTRIHSLSSGSPASPVFTALVHRAMLLPKLVNRGQAYLHLRQAKIPGGKTIKMALQLRTVTM